MFAKQFRLRHDGDIASVLKKGKSVFDPFCGIKYKKNNLPYSRFTVVVGIKVHKSAVRRNKIRRKYREILRLNVQKIKPGFDVMLLVSKKALELSHEEMEQKILHVFRKAKLIRE